MYGHLNVKFITKFNNIFYSTKFALSGITKHVTRTRGQFLVTLPLFDFFFIYSRSNYIRTFFYTKMEPRKQSVTSRKFKKNTLTYSSLPQ